MLSFPLLSPETYPPHPGRPAGAEPAAYLGGTPAIDDQGPGRPRPPFALPAAVRTHLGDIIVSVERAIEQAGQGRGGQTGDVRWAAADELRLLVVHGALHLCGWDHDDPVEGEAMRALEREILASPSSSGLRHIPGPVARPGRMSVSRAATAAVVAGVVATAGLLVLQVLTPQASGTFALLQILAPHLGVLAVALAVLVAIAVRSSASLASLGLIVVVVGARFGDEWISIPGPRDGGERVVKAMTWNLETGPDRAADLLVPLLGMERDVVAFQELTPRVADIIENDPHVTQRYPYRVLIPHPSVRGLGLLSAHPIILEEGRSAPLALHARLDIEGSPVDVVVAHPMPGDIRTGPLRLPIAFDGRERDGRLKELRAWVDEIRQPSTVPLVLIGDLNVAPTEPGYDLIARGFVDVHRAVGLGPGLTWRPGQFERLGLGVLRIDYVLTAGAIQPLSTATTCDVASDHCIVDATLNIRDATGPAA